MFGGLQTILRRLGLIWMWFGFERQNSPDSPERGPRVHRERMQIDSIKSMNKKQERLQISSEKLLSLQLGGRERKNSKSDFGGSGVTHTTGNNACERKCGKFRNRRSHNQILIPEEL
jgi:hypothetical protein